MATTRAGIIVGENSSSRTVLWADGFGITETVCPVFLWKVNKYNSDVSAQYFARCVLKPNFSASFCFTLALDL